MKTETLKKLGLNEDQVKGVMAEYGISVKSLQDSVAGWKEKYEDVSGKLKDFDGVDVQDLRTQITNLQNDITKRDQAQADKEAKAEIDKMIDSILGSDGMKAKNPEIIKSLLNYDALKESKNQKDDAAKQISAWYEKEPGLKDSGKPTPRVVETHTGGTETNDDAKAQANAALRSLFGKE